MASIKDLPREEYLEILNVEGSKSSKNILDELEGMLNKLEEYTVKILERKLSLGGSY